MVNEMALIILHYTGSQYITYLLHDKYGKEIVL